ncbi:hypothetical protein EMIT013CA1_40093 [Bacillus sp. IT-13CA1]
MGRHGNDGTGTIGRYVNAEAGIGKNETGIQQITRTIERIVIIMIKKEG